MYAPAVGANHLPYVQPPAAPPPASEPEKAMGKAAARTSAANTSLTGTAVQVRVGGTVARVTAQGGGQGKARGKVDSCLLCKGWGQVSRQ